MMNNKVIVITLYRRPEYTAELFKALSRCYGIEDYTVLISCDYNPDFHEGCSEAQAIAHRFSHAREEGKTHIYYNNPRKGIDLNKMFILPKAYELSDYVILLEDDTPPAQDALRFFEWVDQRFKDDPLFISASGYNRYIEPETHTYNLEHATYLVDRGTGFCPWGWSMHKDRYEKLMGDGSAYEERWGIEVNGRFDWWFTEMTKTHPGCYAVYPVVPRTNHTGAEGAEHTPSAEWLYNNEWAPFGAWTQDMPDPDPSVWKTKF